MFNYHAEGIYFCWGVEDVIKKNACANGSKNLRGFYELPYRNCGTEKQYIYIYYLDIMYSLMIGIKSYQIWIRECILNLDCFM